MDKNNNNTIKRTDTEGNITKKSRKFLNTLYRLLPVIPVWLFLLSVWKICIPLMHMYPENNIIIIGMIITIIVAILTVLYLIRGRKTKV
ncbi:MAG: hypothetical protein ACTSUE_01060 [Promethearchaeota archaeon]